MAGTGANRVPLGPLHPALRGQKSSGSGESMLNAARLAAARVTANLTRPSPPVPVKQQKPSAALYRPFPDGGDTSAKRRRRSRWGGEEKAPVPSLIPSGITTEQEKQVLLHLKIEDLSRKLRSGDLGIPPNQEDRSPSPEPIYDHNGKRLNTREYRTRKKLEEERHVAVQDAMLSNEEYKPPVDYKPPVQKVSDRVAIPQDEHPHINFVGLLIGPRGNTLKKLEKDTGTKIMIRGKGSVKEGKVGRKDGQPLPGEDEPLHALITAGNAESVKKAVDQITMTIKEGIEQPEGQNDLRRKQLRELAKLNGTLREEDMLRCSNCGATDHRTWQCPEKQNVTSSVLCAICGAAGHVTADCRMKADIDSPFGGQNSSAAGGQQPPGNNMERAKMDSEYMSFMAELGEGPRERPKNRSLQPPSGGGAPPPLLERPPMGQSTNAPQGGPPPPSLNSAGGPNSRSGPNSRGGPNGELGSGNDRDDRMQFNRGGNSYSQSGGGKNGPYSISRGGLPGGPPSGGPSGGSPGDRSGPPGDRSGPPGGERNGPRSFNDGGSFGSSFRGGSPPYKDNFHSGPRFGDGPRPFGRPRPLMGGNPNAYSWRRDREDGRGGGPYGGGPPIRRPPPFSRRGPGGSDGAPPRNMGPGGPMPPRGPPPPGPGGMQGLPPLMQGMPPPNMGPPNMMNSPRPPMPPMGFMGGPPPPVGGPGPAPMNVPWGNPSAGPPVPMPPSSQQGIAPPPSSQQPSSSHAAVPTSSAAPNVMVQPPPPSMSNETSPPAPRGALQYSALSTATSAQIFPWQQAAAALAAVAAGGGSMPPPQGKIGGAVATSAEVTGSQKTTTTPASTPTAAIPPSPPQMSGGMMGIPGGLQMPQWPHMMQHQQAMNMGMMPGMGQMGGGGMMVPQQQPPLMTSPSVPLPPQQQPPLMTSPSVPLQQQQHQTNVSQAQQLPPAPTGVVFQPPPPPIDSNQMASLINAPPPPPPPP